MLGIGCIDHHDAKTPSSTTNNVCYLTPKNGCFYIMQRIICLPNVVRLKCDTPFAQKRVFDVILYVKRIVVSSQFRLFLGQCRIDCIDTGPKYMLTLVGCKDDLSSTPGAKFRGFGFTTTSAVCLIRNDPSTIGAPFQ
jgi:hypothetical protein